MKRIVKSISGDMALWAAGVGALAGFLIPFLIGIVLGLPRDRVLSPVFIALSVLSGLVLGVFNSIVLRAVVGSFLRRMRGNMEGVRSNLSSFSAGGDVGCPPEVCRLETIPAGPLGAVAGEFNELADDLRGLISLERTTGDFLEKLKAATNLENIAATVLTSIRERFGGEAGCLFGVEKGKFVLLKNWNMAIDLERLDAGFLYRTLAEGEVLIFDGVENKSLPPDIGFGARQARYMAIIPFRFQAIPVGVGVLLSQAPFRGNFRDLQGRNFIGQATPFLLNGLLLKRQELLTAVDELTGSLNRRFGMKRLTEEFDRSSRQALPLSVAMVDIDDFQKINEVYGRQAGDGVLRTLAQLIGQNTRSSDFIMRYGGEEFLVTVPGASAQDCYKVMERVRVLAENIKVSSGAHELRFTFSGGVSSFPAAGVCDFRTLIQAAEDALDKAKREGKNRLVVGV